MGNPINNAVINSNRDLRSLTESVLKSNIGRSFLIDSGNTDFNKMLNSDNSSAENNLLNNFATNRNDRKNTTGIFNSFLNSKVEVDNPTIEQNYKVEFDEATPEQINDSDISYTQKKIKDVFYSLIVQISLAYKDFEATGINENFIKKIKDICDNIENVIFNGLNSIFSNHKLSTIYNFIKNIKSKFKGQLFDILTHVFEILAEESFDSDTLLNNIKHVKKIYDKFIVYESLKKLFFNLKTYTFDEYQKNIKNIVKNINTNNEKDFVDLFGINIILNVNNDKSVTHIYNKFAGVFLREKNIECNLKEKLNKNGELNEYLPQIWEKYYSFYKNISLELSSAIKNVLDYISYKLNFFHETIATFFAGNTKEYVAQYLKKNYHSITNLYAIINNILVSNIADHESLKYIIDTSIPAINNFLVELINKQHLFANIDESIFDNVEKLNLFKDKKSEIEEHRKDYQNYLKTLENERAELIKNYNAENLGEDYTKTFREILDKKAKGTLNDYEQKYIDDFHEYIATTENKKKQKYLNEKLKMLGGMQLDDELKKIDLMLSDLILIFLSVISSIDNRVLNVTFNDIFKLIVNISDDILKTYDTDVNPSPISKFNNSLYLFFQSQNQEVKTVENDKSKPKKYKEVKKPVEKKSEVKKPEVKKSEVKKDESELKDEEKNEPEPKKNEPEPKDGEEDKPLIEVLQTTGGRENFIKRPELIEEDTISYYINLLNTINKLELKEKEKIFKSSKLLNLVLLFTTVGIALIESFIFTNKDNDDEKKSELYKLITLSKKKHKNLSPLTRILITIISLIGNDIDKDKEFQKELILLSPHLLSNIDIIDQVELLLIGAASFATSLLSNDGDEEIEKLKKSITSIVNFITNNTIIFSSGKINTLKSDESSVDKLNLAIVSIFINIAPSRILKNINSKINTSNKFFEHVKHIFDYLDSLDTSIRTKKIINLYSFDKLVELLNTYNIANEFPHQNIKNKLTVIENECVNYYENININNYVDLVGSIHSYNNSILIKNLETFDLVTKIFYNGINLNEVYELKTKEKKGRIRAEKKKLVNNMFRRDKEQSHITNYSNENTKVDDFLNNFKTLSDEDKKKILENIINNMNQQKRYQ